MICIVVAIGKHGELGLDNKLIFHNPEDMAFFKELTLGHTVVMGRKTYESIGGPLKGRRNLIATKNSSYSIPAEHVEQGAQILSNLDEFLEENERNREKIFVIGGASIYEQALPYADILFITQFEAGKEADTYFPTPFYDYYTMVICGRKIDGGEITAYVADEIRHEYKNYRWPNGFNLT